ncbi:hypothetical protein AX17_002027 [Amanita inopinata Kibby_2008]|nr:hypothetical protein AX17_002027 [Amanita inopinata Kibby_2008]
MTTVDILSGDDWNVFEFNPTLTGVSQLFPPKLAFSTPFCLDIDIEDDGGGGDGGEGGSNEPSSSTAGHDAFQVSPARSALTTTLWPVTPLVGLELTIQPIPSPSPSPILAPLPTQSAGVVATALVNAI